MVIHFSYRILSLLISWMASWYARRFLVVAQRYPLMMLHSMVITIWHDGLIESMWILGDWTTISMNIALNVPIHVNSIWLEFAIHVNFILGNLILSYLYLLFCVNDRDMIKIGELAFAIKMEDWTRVQQNNTCYVAELFDFTVNGIQSRCRLCMPLRMTLYELRLQNHL